MKNLKFQYFYHPDHLGSSSYITDASGEVYQHLEYFAFGETFVEEHSNTHRTPYLFNGKELDEETGLYYYGARYYDARTSIWLAVDPLAEKYPGWSPYNYTMNNPINLIDPDGRSPGDPSCPECPEYTQITPPISGELAGTPKTFEHSLEGAQYRDNQKTMSPVKNPVISSEFGGRDAPIAGASTDHKGIDIVQAEVGAVEGADVVAPLNGTVIAVKDNNTYPNNAGNRVHMKANKDGKIHSFFHLQDTGFGNDFSAGDKIQRGQKIGQVGNSGNSEAVHLHYEIRDNPGSGAAYSPRFENVGLRNAPNTTQARTRQVVPTYVPFSSEFKGPEF